MTKSVFLVLLAAGISTAQDFDILITNGRVVDGTGNPAVHGDIGIKDGRIAAMGILTGRKATRTIDGSRLVVCPGFIDMHNHSDDAVLTDGNAESMVRMGVTSMILGEGTSSAPTARFPRFRDYWAALLKGGVSTNIGSYVGTGLVFE